MFLWLLLCELWLASVSVAVGPGRLDVLLGSVPVRDPAAAASVGVGALGGGAVAGSPAGAVQFLRLVGELVFVQDAALLHAQLLRLGPRLLLPRGKNTCTESPTSAAVPAQILTCTLLMSEKHNLTTAVET